MARRRRIKKIEPCERILSFVLPNGFSMLDVGFALSRLNRKAYRQGMEYVISNIEVFGQVDTPCSVGLARLTQNWVTCNSWTKGFYHWKSQRDEAMEAAGSESTEAKYADFKIFMNERHWNNPTPLLPVNCVDEATAVAIDGTVATEWDMSQVVVPNDGAVGVTNEYNLMMCGDDMVVGPKGLIHNYAISRARPQLYDPNIAAPSIDGGLYQDMVDVGDNLEDVLSNTRIENWVTPYLMGTPSPFTPSDYEWYPGGANQPDAGITAQDFLTVRGGSGSVASDNSGPFSAYCGLVLLNNIDDVENLVVNVHIAPGDYHGVAARPMQDVN